VNFYKKLYCEQYRWGPKVDALSFISIDDGERIWMEREFEECEVWEVVWNFNGDKAPRLDGFTMAFFQKCWEVIKEDIMVVLKEFQCSTIVENFKRVLLLCLYRLFRINLE
jgi:hypothetical protein